MAIPAATQEPPAVGSRWQRIRTSAMFQVTAVTDGGRGDAWTVELTPEIWGRGSRKVSLSPVGLRTKFKEMSRDPA